MNELVAYIYVLCAMRVKFRNFNGKKKYLLYIDILGFADLVKNNYGKITELFQTIDSLNAHAHGNFQTIVFSDTILIFNKEDAKSHHDHTYLVMYACEFAQDLLYRCVALGIQFRAILTYEEFYYEKLKNIEAYHGKALVNAYNKEKEINGQGLFIDKNISTYNNFFPTAEFDKHLDFVYLTKALERLKFYGTFQIDRMIIEETMEFSDLHIEVKYLEILKKNIDKQQDSKIRGKYLQTYHYYKLRYGKIIELFEENSFNHKSISPNANWLTE